MRPEPAIRGAAELLHEEMPAEQRDKFLRNIEAETVRVQEIVDRLLLLSSVEAKKTLDAQGPVDLAEILERTTNSVAAQAAGKGIELRTEVLAGKSVVAGDEFLLEKAVLNLLQNAIAFAPAAGGRIAVSLQRKDGLCAITVEDNGPGVPDYAQGRIYERFFSLPRPDTGKKSSGLGLTLVREIASLHRGSITLTNADGGGAVAELVLPLATSGIA